MHDISEFALDAGSKYNRCSSSRQATAACDCSGQAAHRCPGRTHADGQPAGAPPHFLTVQLPLIGIPYI